VSLLGDDARLLGAALLDRFPRDVADVDARVMGDEGLGNDAPDARRAGADEDAQSRLHAPVGQLAHGFALPSAAFRRLHLAAEVDTARAGVLANPVSTTTTRVLFDARTQHWRGRHDRPQAHRTAGTRRQARRARDPLALAHRRHTAGKARRL